MLFDVVYEFFVKYIFGGILVRFAGDSVVYDYYYTFIIPDNNNSWSSTAKIVALSFTDINGINIKLSLGNYLSLISTIISMVVIVVLACLFIKKIYNMCAHIIA